MAFDPVPFDPVPFDPACIRVRLDSLAKPPGSLGRLEQLAERLCRIQRTLTPSVAGRRLIVFAADHGVVAEGVSAWPSAVTRLVVGAMVSGQAASSVLARSAGARMRVVDVGLLEGVEAPAIADTGIESVRRRVRSGSRNMAREPALTVEEFRAAWRVGVEEATRAAREGDTVIVGGEVGIGNTTSAAALARLLADVPAEFATGRGAGADDRVWACKREVVESAVARARAIWGTDTEGAIASVCGLEIAALAGCFAEFARVGGVVLLDGYVAGAAALVAERLSPGTRAACIAAHRSAEPGHAGVLRGLGLEPLLEGWEMRLGEGTGGLIALPLLDAAVAMLTRMATLAELGVGVSDVGVSAAGDEPAGSTP